jgi:hypothetical protein
VPNILPPFWKKYRIIDDWIVHDFGAYVSEKLRAFFFSKWGSLGLHY